MNEERELVQVFLTGDQTCEVDGILERITRGDWGVEILVKSESGDDHTGYLFPWHAVRMIRIWNEKDEE